MTIADLVQYANIATGISSNSLLIYLSVRFSNKNLGTYKYLLMIFASYDIFLTIIHAIIDTWPALFYCACFTVPFALANINFLHRFRAVKKAENLSRFSSPSFVVALATYPIGQGVGWFSLEFQADSDDSHFVENSYFERYNITVTGFTVMHHWKDGLVNVRATVILAAAVAIMSLHFSIAAFLASRTMIEIRKAKTFSSNYKMLQIKILRALFAQAAVPVFLVYILFGCVITLPFLKLRDILHIADFCMMITSFFPAWDAIVVILLIKDYRDGLLSLFCPPSSSSTTATTVWMTEMPTSSMRLT